MPRLEEQRKSYGSQKVLCHCCIVIIGQSVLILTPEGSNIICLGKFLRDVNMDEDEILKILAGP